MNQQLDVEEIESISTQLFQIVGLQIPQLCEARKVISMFTLKCVLRNYFWSKPFPRKPANLWQPAWTSCFKSWVFKFLSCVRRLRLSQCVERQQRAVRWKRTQCAERLFLDPPCSNQNELNLSQICAEVVFLGFHPLTSPSMFTFATKGHHNHCHFMYWTVRILHYNVLYQMNES